MMGPTNTSVVREEVRKAFNMSDPELLAWFNRQIKDVGTNEANQTEIETLRLLRDTLIKDTEQTRHLKT